MSDTLRRGLAPRAKGTQGIKSGIAVLGGYIVHVRMMEELYNDYGRSKHKIEFSARQLIWGREDVYVNSAEAQNRADELRNYCMAALMAANLVL